MGYRTEYTLTTTPPNCRESICAALVALNGYSPFGDGDGCKWYDHAEHIAAVSARFPAVIISVEGQGEDPGDRWVMHALAGATVRHRREDWTPPPPSAEMLAARLAACGVAGPGFKSTDVRKRV